MKAFVTTVTFVSMLIAGQMLFLWSANAQPNPCNGVVHGCACEIHLARQGLTLYPGEPECKEVVSGTLKASKPQPVAPAASQATTQAPCPTADQPTASAKTKSR
jgi:hypothetical protein